MSIFSTIMSKILGHPVDPPATETAPPAPALQSAAAPPPAAASAPPVDVDAVLTAMAAKNGQALNWKQSIVDLMKLLDLDSSVTARKQLATELHYSGNAEDSATMNVWLHQQVMQKLAENGGKLPAGL